MSKHKRPDLGQMTVADFKERIRQMKLAGDGLTIRGAPRANPCVVRNPENKTPSEAEQ